MDAGGEVVVRYLGSARVFFAGRKFMLDFGRFEWVSFDCYGTLVDWETGISGAVSEVLESRGMGMSRAEILGLFAEVEPRVQASETFVKYRRVLWRVMGLMGSELGRTIQRV